VATNTIWIKINIIKSLFTLTHSQLYRKYRTVDEGSKNWEFCESQTFNNLYKKEMVSSFRTILQKTQQFQSVK
jgi:hypothetical protein